MPLLPYIIDNFTNLPYPFGAFLALIPYEVRPGIGRIYRRRLKEIERFENAPIVDRKAFIFQRMKTIVQHAQTEVEFYKQHYKKHSFTYQNLTDFDSLDAIPIVTKGDLQEYSIEDRSAPNVTNRYRANTGGSTGMPLGFYVEPSSIGHERAHIFKAWSRLGFRHRHYTLALGGRSKSEEAISYDSLRHQFYVNIFRPHDEICSYFRELNRTKKFQYLHGYPSAIYDFALYCDDQAPDVRDILRESLKGIFLVSEYPQPFWRETTESVFGAPTQSFYGHTERCIFAYESGAHFDYFPLQTYGFAETISDNREEFLIGTSYYNFASPMIRYNTEDVVSHTKCDGGILKKFNIFTGRRGDFILDKSHKRIPLTGLIFGRHHELFNVCSHIQVSQTEPGYATVYYCGLEQPIQNPSPLFDQSGVDIEFSFQELAEPILTSAGKMKLLVSRDRI